MNLKANHSAGPIGVFDSGYGGLTILRSIRQHLPEYDYMYLGDNARAPYGSRSFEVIYRFTLEAVRYLFDSGCNLVILACNTASAKALAAGAYCVMLGGMPRTPVETRPISRTADSSKRMARPLRLAINI